VRRLIAALALAAGLVPAAGAHAVTPVDEPALDGPLSNETTLTRWAHPREDAWVRARPEASSPRVATLRTRTEDGLPEVSLLLARLTDPAGRVWIRIRVAGRPNGRTGWVPREKLRGFRVLDTQLVVDRRQLRITLRRAGRAVWSAPIGVGKRATPTPAGRFWIREGFRVPKGFPIYGPYAFGTSGYSVLSDWPGGGVVGIHGTDQPGLLPGRVSHGCIRLRNRDVSWLARHLPIGTPVLIR
jgi:hypothetical protein